MPKRRQLRGFDLKQIDGYDFLIGVDEAGRGALAGSVSAGAVMVTRDFLESNWVAANARRINDSKQLTATDRDALWLDFEALMAEQHIHVNFGMADVAEIEQLNILGATKLAMRRALEGIFPPAAFEQKAEPDLFSSAAEVEAFQPQVSARILVDGLRLKHFPYPHHNVVRGDARSLCIAMASVVAKVSRDREMLKLDQEFPGYGFGSHKGYGTDEHREAILRLGRCRFHRTTFLRKLMAKRVEPGQMDFLK